MKEILLVDDDQDMCELLAELLAALGVGTCVAAHSLEDVRKLGRVPRDVAVIDVNLGRNAPSGVDVHHWLKEHDFRGRVVFLTGHAQSSPIVRAALGVPNVTLLTKPVSVEQLLSVIG